MIDTVLFVIRSVAIGLVAGVIVAALWPAQPLGVVYVTTSIGTIVAAEVAVRLREREREKTGHG